MPDVLRPLTTHRAVFPNRRIIGAPDFVMEVLSPSTRAKDILIKTRKYALAGVREYRIVDPAHELVTKYLFSPAVTPEAEEDRNNTQLIPDGPDIAIYGYTFEEAVPVTVPGGECAVCFADIARQYDISSIPQ